MKTAKDERAALKSQLTGGVTTHDLLCEHQRLDLIDDVEEAVKLVKKSELIMRESALDLGTTFVLPKRSKWAKLARIEIERVERNLGRQYRRNAAFLKEPSDE